jgi:hypothetical protein
MGWTMGVSAVFHQPHPGNEMKKGSVESAREFLERARTTPQPKGGRCCHHGEETRACLQALRRDLRVRPKRRGAFNA